VRVLCAWKVALFPEEVSQKQGQEAGGVRLSRGVAGPSRRGLKGRS